MRKSILLACIWSMAQVLLAQTAVHPSIGTKTTSADGKITIELVHKLQNFSGGKGYEPDINSPKSVNIHPNGNTFYVNSLEGFKTVCFEMGTFQKKKVIRHRFTQADAILWAKPSGLWPFRHYSKNLNTFSGKPVESAFSHNGRYLWVPYYRRSYDINAQDPSAVAVIDTKTDSIVRMFEAGVLPKMIAVSPDNKHVAISHWGDNTVGLINIEGKMEDWHYTNKFIVEKQLIHNLSLTEPVNRDVNSGFCLRGTVFTPDSRYLFVGCMGGSAGIAIIDVQAGKYLGRVMGMMSNMRHLVIKNGYLYLSINNAGYVQRIPLKDFMAAVEQLGGSTRTAKVTGWVNCKVPAGARTLELSHDGKYIFVACNFSSRLCVVDAQKMQVVAEIAADSFPVGLDISKDGQYVITTAQGRSGAGGGNCVDIFRITYK